MDYRRYGFIAAIVVVLIGIVARLGSAQVPPAHIVASMIGTAIAVATPLTLGALCGVYCERSGVVNIGIEGMMLSAAFFGWFAALYCSAMLHAGPTASLLVGVFFAVLSGALMGLLHAALTVSFGVDQIIAGTVVNLLAIGMTGFFNRQLFFGHGNVFGGSVPPMPRGSPA